MSGRTLPRRTALQRLGALAAAGSAVGLGVSHLASRPTAAVEVDADDEFLAENVRVERNDGELDAVSVAPELAVSWRDFGGGLDSLEVTLSAAIEDQPGFDVLLDGDVADGTVADDAVDDGEVTVTGDDFAAVAGHVDMTFDRLDLTAVGDAVTTTDFGTNLGPGETATTTVELTLRVDVVGAQGDAETSFAVVTFDVTVTNPEGSATVDGRANTDAE